MKVDFFDKKGSIKESQYNFGKEFDIEPNLDVVAQYNYIFLSNQRNAKAKAKNRAEVSGGGRKPWKQKGTGRARHGSIRSPIWKGGGVTFGPTGTENFKKRMPKKMRKLAFLSAISLKALEKKFVVLEELEINKTRDAKKILSNIMKVIKERENGDVLVVQSKVSKYETVFRNLENVEIKRIGELNAYDVLTARNVLFFEKAAESLKELNKKQ